MIEELKDVMKLATGATVFINEILKLKKNNKKQDEEEAIISSKCDSAQIASSGFSARIGSSGDYVQIGSAGNYAQIASAGNSAQIASAGSSAQIGSAGNYAQIGSAGNSAQIASSGFSARIGSSGSSAQIGSAGNYAQIASSGYSARIASSGFSAQIASSGDYALIDSNGKKSIIANIGFKSVAKGKIGSWITLAEYKEDEENNIWVVDFVKTEYIDGVKIKEDIYYTLYNHEFAEVVIIDDVKTIILNCRKNIIKGLYLDSLEPCYVVEKDGVYSHGDTLKEAKDSLIYKITNRDTSMYKDYTLETKVTFEEAVKMYRVITGACEGGTRNFVENVLKNKKEKYTVKEIIAETQGQYGNDKLKEFFGVN